MTKKQVTRNNNQTIFNYQYPIIEIFEYLKIEIWNLLVSCILYLGYFTTGRWRLSLHNKKGSYLPVILMASVLFMAFSIAVISLSLSSVKIANLHNDKITSMSIAEAGIDYYLWHLAHDNEDYCDGHPSCDGSTSFKHDYTDQSGKVLGTYDLFITPPSAGQSSVIVKSVGKVKGSNPTRTIVTTIGMPSFSKYTLLVNGTQLWVGANEKVDGSVHVNDSGMYNQGIVTGDASSTESSYPSWSWGTQPGVAGPSPLTDHYKGNISYPVPRVDFDKLDVDIRAIRDSAKAGGEGYYDNAPVGSVGYHIVLKTDDTYDLYKVKSFDSNGLDVTKETLMGNHSFPSSGIIFLEDDTWVNGTIDGQKITIVAADPEESGSKQKRLIIPDPIKYTHYDGTDKIGLITQTHITVSHNANTNMEIDAAMIAKNGYISICPEIEKPPYKCPAHPAGYLKNKIKVYGSMAHNTGLVWTIDWGGGVESGYKNTETVIDTFNVLNPPPKFPLTGTYVILNWREE